MRFRMPNLILLSILMGCTQADQRPAATNTAGKAHPRIAITSLPLFEMTRSIVGDAADTVLVVPPGTTSRDWSPTSDDARLMQQSQLILISGAGYEPWKDHVSLPGSRLRDTAAGYYQQLIRVPDAVTHRHGPDGPHSHPGTVWATWLDPDLCIAQLHEASRNCERLLPDRRQAIQSAEAKLSAELNTLNVIIDSIKSDEAIIAFSDTPRYQYLARRLNWTLHYLHWDNEDTLTAENRSELIDAFEADTSGKSRRIFLLDSRRSADTEDFILKSGGTVVRIDLCETPSPDSTPLPDRLKNNLQRIKAIFDE